MSVQEVYEFCTSTSLSESLLLLFRLGRRAQRNEFFRVCGTLRTFDWRAHMHTYTDALLWQPHINEMKGIKVENQRVKPSAWPVGGYSSRDSFSLLV